MKKSFVIVILVLVVCMCMFGCSKDEVENPVVQKEAESMLFTNEATQLKENFITSLQRIRELEEKNLSRSGEFSNDEVNELLKVLSRQTVEMFNSYGLRDSWEEFDSLEDPRIALVGIMFLGLLETNNEIEGSALLLSRSFESGGSGECFDYYKVAKCIVSALIGINWDTIATAFAGYTCITKAVAKSVFKKLVLSVSGASLVVALYEFTDCMGWI